MTEYELDVELALELIEKQEIAFPLGPLDWRSVMELVKDCVKLKGDA